MKIILLNETCEYHKPLFMTQSLFSAIMQNPMEKNWLVVKGTQGDANFRVGLHKYVIPAPLYNNTILNDIVIFNTLNVPFRFM